MCSNRAVIVISLCPARVLKSGKEYGRAGECGSVQVRWRVAAREY